MNSKTLNEIKLEKHENITKIKIFPLFLSEFSYLIIVSNNFCFYTNFSFIS